VALVPSDCFKVHIAHWSLHLDEKYGCRSNKDHDRETSEGVVFGSGSSARILIGIMNILKLTIVFQRITMVRRIQIGGVVEASLSTQQRHKRSTDQHSAIFQEYQTQPSCATLIFFTLLDEIHSNLRVVVLLSSIYLSSFPNIHPYLLWPLSQL
jgi:hypothetical protein